MSSDTDKTGKPKYEGRPQGFTPGNPREEAARARQADTGRYSVTSDADSKYYSYTVSEERGFSPWTDNTSIQSVRYTEWTPGEITAAELVSTRHGKTEVLRGLSDGRVTLYILIGGSEEIAEKDVTQQALALGITAAGIRRTQQDIAGDGDVTRPEQERIIKDIERIRKSAERTN